jgi:hypothetical protein
MRQVPERAADYSVPCVLAKAYQTFDDLTFAYTKNLPRSVSPFGALRPAGRREWGEVTTVPDCAAHPLPGRAQRQRRCRSTSSGIWEGACGGCRLMASARTYGSCGRLPPSGRCAPSLHLPRCCGAAYIPRRLGSDAPYICSWSRPLGRVRLFGTSRRGQGIARAAWWFV